MGLLLLSPMIIFVGTPSSGLFLYSPSNDQFWVTGVVGGGGGGGRDIVQGMICEKSKHPTPELVGLGQTTIRAVLHTYVYLCKCSTVSVYAMAGCSLKLLRTLLFCVVPTCSASFQAILLQCQTMSSRPSQEGAPDSPCGQTP